MERHKTDQLQFIRFLALIPIVLWHMFNMGYAVFDISYDNRFREGLNCVSFFFVLSGFLSGYLSYEKDVSFSLKDSLNFVWKKLKKLYPLYLVVTLYSISLTELPVLIAHSDFGENTRYLILLLVRHLLLIQSWVKVYPGEYFCFSEVGWFLSTIMFLYLIDIPLRAAFTAIRRKVRSGEGKNREAVRFVIIAIAAVILTAAYCFALRNTDVEYTENTIPISRVGEYVAGMSLGYLLYPIFNRETGERTYNKAVFTVLETLTILIYVTIPLLPTRVWDYRTVRWIIPNLLLITVFGMGRGVISSIFRWAPLKYLGNISFGIFLIHSMVIKSITVYNLAGASLDSKLGKLATGSLCIAVTILLTSLIMKDGKTRN